MQLIERINALAETVANYLRDSVLPRLLPAGGAAGQVLAKTAAGDFAVGWQAAGGGSGGSSVASGRGEIDFGVGGNDAVLVITDQAAITAQSRVFVTPASVDTADHTADEVVICPPPLVVRDIVPGTGFTIAGVCPFGSHGKYAVDWMWV